MDWLIVLFITEIALLMLSFYLSGQDVMTPSVIMCVMFTISTGFALYGNIKLNISYSFEAYAILTLGITTFVLSEAVFRSKFQERPLRRYIADRAAGKPAQFQAVDVQTWMLVVLIVLNIMAIVWLYFEVCAVAGTTGVGAFSAFRKLTANLVLADQEDRVINIWLSQCIKVSTAGGHISIFIILQRRFAKKAWSVHDTGLLLCALLAQAPTILKAARTNLLRFACAILIMVYILWHQKNGWHRNLSWKYMRVGVLCLVLGIPAFYYSCLLMGRSSSVTPIDVDYIIMYVGNAILLFDAFIKNPTEVMGFGEETFAGFNSFLRRTFGLDVYVRDTNLEFRDGIRGNVYTFFRRPLHDFGFWGMIVFTILVALLFAWIYYKKIKWRPRTRKPDVWVLIYGFLYYWIISSSILQTGVLYFTFDTVSTIVIMVIGYHLMTRVRLVRHSGAPQRAVLSPPLDGCGVQRGSVP